MRPDQSVTRLTLFQIKAASHNGGRRNRLGRPNAARVAGGVRCRTRSMRSRPSGRRAPMSTRRSTRRCTSARSKDPNGFWAEQAKRIHWYRTPSKIKNVSYAPDNVSIKWFEDGVTNVAYNCIDRHLRQARQPDRDHLGRRRPEGRQEDHLSGAARRGVPDGQHPAQPQRREGRPRHHLHADDSGGRLRDARLRAHRRDPFGGVRRLLAGFARRPHRGLQVERRHHGGRRPARRPQGAAQGQCGCGDRQGRRRSTTSSWCSAPARKVEMDPVRDVYYHEAAEGRDQRVPVRAHERRGPAVHPLHLGLDRQAEGRAAHHRAATTCSPR